MKTWIPIARRSLVIGFILALLFYLAWVVSNVWESGFEWWLTGGLQPYVAVGFIVVWAMLALVWFVHEVGDRRVEEKRKRMQDAFDILIPNPLDDASFEKAATRWDDGMNLRATLPHPMSQAEIETMVTFLLEKGPRELVFVLLSDLAEDSAMRPDLLERIFDTGDESCQVSVCLRSNLSSALEEKCRTARNEQVRAQYEARLRYSQQE